LNLRNVELDKFSVDGQCGGFRDFGLFVRKSVCEKDKERATTTTTTKKEFVLKFYFKLQVDAHEGLRLRGNFVGLCDGVCFALSQFRQLFLINRPPQVSERELKEGKTKWE
jgi:hypothetical protein